MRKLQRVAILCAVSVLQGRDVAAQSGNISVPNCQDADFAWTFNKERQSPCLVGAILQSLCFGNTWRMDPLTPGRQYGGALKNQSSSCQCNTVAFSLIAACGACQGGAPASWDAWRFNCTETDVAIGRYPLTIPFSTAVPAWAYLDVTATGDTWDQTAAFATSQTNTTEIQGGTSPLATSVAPSVATSVLPSVVSTAVPSASPIPASSGSTSKAGPIAGGVVGGVVGLAALALLGFILYRKKHRPADTSHITEKTDVAQVSSPVSQGSDFYGHLRSPSDDPPKLYNPSDPSTFPPTPPQSHYLPSYSPQSPVAPFVVPGSRTDLGGKPVGYQGVPEV